MRIKIAKKFFLYFTISLVVLSSIEGLFRLYLTLNTIEPVIPKSVVQFNELLGWSLKPRACATSSRTGCKIEYKINSKGLRDDESSYVKPDGVFRIILLGDSRTFGFGVSIDKHFSVLLERLLKNVEIINMGVHGFGVDQELLYLQYEGVRYNPDLVLVYISHYGGHRHMHTVRWNTQKPRFLLKEGKLELTNSPVSKPFDVDNPHNWFIKNFKTYNLILQTYQHLKSKEVNKNNQVTQDEQDQLDLKDQNFKDELYLLGETIVKKMDEISKQSGAKFVLVTQIKELHKKMTKLGIHSLDVFDILNNPKFSLPDGLGHINELGNQVLAREIENFLKINKLIPEKHLI